jgi:inner membrane protein
MVEKFTGRVPFRMIDLRPLYIALLALAFVIPLHMIAGVIHDRIMNQNIAVENIAASWAKQQRFLTPVLFIPYKETVTINIPDPQVGQKVIARTEKIDRFYPVLPEQLAIKVDLQAEQRRRGIHKVPVYTAIMAMQGDFPSFARAVSDAQRTLPEAGQPFISIGMSDVRGMGSESVFTWNGKNIPLEPGSNIFALSQGVHVPVSFSQGMDRISFSLNMKLKGVQEFHVVPAASKVSMEGSSNWPHPSFNGQFLPDRSEVGADGFTAGWSAGILATNIKQRIDDCLKNGRSCDDFWQTSFGVSLFQPVDIYHQSSRAARYGLLFVGLTFAILYVAEILMGIRVHMVQFLLAGGALAIFYLLLVSLSEFIGFGLSYLVAAAATIGLLTYYLRYVLGSGNKALLVGGIIAILYGILYSILLAEDFALLMGSLLLFVILAGFMYVTRNIDWAAMAAREAREKQEGR